MGSHLRYLLWFRPLEMCLSGPAVPEAKWRVARRSAHHQLLPHHQQIVNAWTLALQWIFARRHALTFRSILKQTIFCKSS